MSQARYGNSNAVGKIPASRIRPYVRELELRCGGLHQAAEYCGVGHMTLYRISKGYREAGTGYEDHQGVRENTARLIFIAVFQRRKEDRRNGVSENFQRALVRQAENNERMLRLTGY